MKNQDIFKMQMSINKDLYIFANEIILELMEKNELCKDDFIKAFKKLLKVDSSKCGEYTKIFNKYKVICKKYFYDDDYETVFETLFYVSFKKEMPDSVKVKIIKDASMCDNKEVDRQY